MDNDVMVMLGARWCDDRADLFADELIELFRQKTEGELVGVPPSVARSMWNRAISRLFLEVNLPEDLHEQTLCGLRVHYGQRNVGAFSGACGGRASLGGRGPKAWRSWPVNRICHNESSLKIATTKEDRKCPREMRRKVL